MFHLFEHLAKFTIASGTGSNCDDFVDRLNRKYTIYFLLLCCAIISSKQYVGDPLSCFCPSHFTGAHVEYTNNICWISNAYYVPIDDTFSVNDNSNILNYNNNVGDDDDKPSSPIRVVRVNNLIAYYPFLLLLQAMCFYIPFFLWKNIVNHSAYDISTLINYAKETQDDGHCSHDNREKSLKYLIRHIDRASNYYNTKKFLQFYGSMSSTSSTNFTSDDETATIIIETNKTTNNDNNDDNDKASSISSNHTIKRKNSSLFAHNSNTKFDFSKSYLNEAMITNKKSINKKTGKDNSKCMKCRRWFRLYIHNSLCEKFLFTLYLIIKLFYFTNSFGQLLLLNKLITGDTSSIQKLISTLSSYSSAFSPPPSSGSSANTNNNEDLNSLLNQHKQLLQSIFTITNKNDVLLVQQKYDNSNYFLMAGNNIWTGFQFGYKTIVNLIQTGSLFNSHTRLLIFHSVIFCDFKIRVLGDRLHKHTVQCVAPINIFSEKLFTLIWFWLLILSIINAYNLLEWLNFYLFSRIRLNFLFNYLNLVFSNNNKVSITSTTTTTTTTTAAAATASNTNLSDTSTNTNKILNLKFKNKQKIFSNSNTISLPKHSHKNHTCNCSNNSCITRNEDVFKLKFNEKISIIKQNLDKSITKKIIKSYLELDNLFIIRMISKNTNEIITQELIILLLDYYQNKKLILNDDLNNECKKSINL